MTPCMGLVDSVLAARTRLFEHKLEQFSIEVRGYARRDFTSDELLMHMKIVSYVAGLASSELMYQNYALDNGETNQWDVPLPGRYAPEEDVDLSDNDQNDPFGVGEYLDGGGRLVAAFTPGFTLPKQPWYRLLGETVSMCGDPKSIYDLACKEVFAVCKEKMVTNWPEGAAVYVTKLEDALSEGRKEIPKETGAQIRDDITAKLRGPI